MRACAVRIAPENLPKCAKCIQPVDLQFCTVACICLQKQEQPLADAVTFSAAMRASDSKKASPAKTFTALLLQGKRSALARRRVGRLAVSHFMACHKGTKDSHSYLVYQAPTLSQQCAFTLLHRSQTRHHSWGTCTVLPTLNACACRPCRLLPTSSSDATPSSCPAGAARPAQPVALPCFSPSSARTAPSGHAGGRHRHRCHTPRCQCPCLGWPCS